MKKHLSTIIPALVFIAGLSLLLYPTVSNFWNSMHQSLAVANYSDAIDKMNQQEKQAAIDAAVAYNESLLLNDDRFTPTEDELNTYKNLLNVDGTGMMGYITIPSINVKLAMYHTVDASVLQIGVGHLEGSSLPVGGKGTHTVLSSHRGLPSAKLFTDLDQLKKGDLFYLHVYDKVLTYEVDQITIVEPTDFGQFQIEEDKDLCTLFTCTPYGINTHRLLVRGHRVENTSTDANLISEASKISPTLVAACIGVILLVVICIIFIVIRKRSKRETFMKKHIYQNILKIFLILSACIFSFTCAYAEETGSITVNTPIEDMKVSLYHVGEFTEQGTFTLAKQYQSYSVALDHSSSEEWQATANTLAQYIERDGIHSDADGISSSNASLTFNHLTCGLYLMIGSEKEVNDHGSIEVYTPQVSFIALPDVSTDDPYHISTIMKYEKNDYTQTSLHVLKVWKQDTANTRPASIQVDLLQKDTEGNTIVFDQQILSDDNQWLYTWNDLSSRYTWNVVETTVPEGYTESSIKEGNTVVLTNTSTTPVIEEKPKPSNQLPLTGQLQWPIPVLVIAGIMFLIIGKACRKYEE